MAEADEGDFSESDARVGGVDRLIVACEQHLG